MRLSKATMVAVLLLMMFSGPSVAGDNKWEDFISEGIKELREGQKQIISLVVKVDRNTKDIKEVDEKADRNKEALSKMDSWVATFESEKKKMIKGLENHIESDKQRIADRTANRTSYISMFIAALSMFFTGIAVYKNN